MMTDQNTTNRYTPIYRPAIRIAPGEHVPATSSPADLPTDGAAVSPDATDLGDALLRVMAERTQLMDQVDSFDTLGEFRKLDAVEQTLMRREAAYRTSVAVQIQLLERARQALAEEELPHSSRHLAELQSAFLSSMEGAVRYESDWDDLLRGATVYAAHRVRADVQTSLRAYRALQRNYAWRRFRWAIWRHSLWIVGLAALLAVIVVAAPLRSALPILLIATGVVLTWLLSRTLLAGFVERGLVHQRRRYLRGWTRDLSAMELRLRPVMLLAVMALEHEPIARQTRNLADAKTDTH